jgi:uncharacterized protein YjbJ (UPF0337 family)
MRWNDWRVISCSSETTKAQALPASRIEHLLLVAVCSAAPRRLGMRLLIALRASVDDTVNAHHKASRRRLLEPGCGPVRLHTVAGAYLRRFMCGQPGELDMDKDTIKGNFKQLKGKIKQQWGKLTDDEIDQMEGNAEILSGKLQEPYGLEKDEAERQAREFRSSNNWN